MKGYGQTAKHCMTPLRSLQCFGYTCRPIKAAWKTRFGNERDGSELPWAQTVLKNTIYILWFILKSYFLANLRGCEGFWEIFMVKQLRFLHHSSDRTWDTTRKSGVISHVDD